MMNKFVVPTLLLFLALLTPEAESFRWCTKSLRETAKCKAIRSRLQRRGTPFGFTCVMGYNTELCITLIKENYADVMMLDAGDIFTHASDFRIIVSEKISLQGASYYPVVAVKKDADSHINIHTKFGLSQAKTCHTGVGKTAGWNMPMGHFKRFGIDTGRIAASCAPGATQSKYRRFIEDAKPGSFSSTVATNQWCSLCVGNTTSGTGKCQRSKLEEFYGYDGALACLESGGGEIAFIKHSTIADDQQDKYKLLCKNGTRAHPSQWMTCNLGKVPSHALVARADTSQSDVTAIYNRLQSMWTNLSGDLELRNDAAKDRKDLMWSSESSELVGEGGRSALDFIGSDYACNMHHVQGNTPPPSLNCD